MEVNIVHEELYVEQTKTLLLTARFNQNRDPKTGRYTFGDGSSDSSSGGSSDYGKSAGGATYKKADEGTQLKHEKSIARLNSSDYDNGTYDLDTLDLVDYSDGYQVTFRQIGDNYSNSEYADKVNEFLAETSDGITSAGKFGSTPEVSFHFVSREKAIELGKKYNQQSVLDWKMKEKYPDDEARWFIELGGTGRRA